MKFASNSKYSTSSKDLSIKHFNLKDMIKNDQIIINYVESQNKLVDIITKVCETMVHARLVRQVMEFGK